ncbi:Lrp/AsnC family transcriptional regulator [Acuticoccus mangrovi]|uniref:Lrp/AsnC family transcriptional regulator n=1 Tax=Acuticoccus mangrovi TaxID=2796142 RepID=A0A934IKA5_9HYPH|nr:Lrp/AsnC family transcriptional regulator [Acuticoccus mangrovi]MBJ3775352.1 Lrp/AsnC family transcriptional regulator [Acuticoccus mangrovi]
MTKLGDTDRRLLALLKDNARLSLTELAHHLSLSRTTVKQRLERLVARGRIRKFTVMTDVDEEPGVRAIMMVELNGSMSRMVIEALRAIPDIASLHSTNGAWDLVAEIRTETLGDLDRVLREVREIPGVVSSETNLLLAAV